MKDLSRWQARPTPGCTMLEGTHVRLEPVQWGRHGSGLMAAVGGGDKADLWRYMALGPFDDVVALQTAFDKACQTSGWRTMVIVCANTGVPLGMASYMRNREAHGSTEVGCVAFSHALQRTTAATETIYLMARHVFEDLGYRRFEWKCDDTNEASKRAALRFGFAYEGTFRNDMVIKGRNRDTAWYAMTDGDWPAIANAFCAWLSPMNFDAGGKQIARLESFRASR
ncbi:GNAT family N-acetyltransferase [Kordiimonas sp.]|uniref:GNAT family N-acetyltransferase n=1 Tax=Kordiimonas sp. TaxID=1970157 RepID=UPI003A8F2114